MPSRTSRRDRTATAADQPLRFEQRLVLHQWLLDLFGVSSFERLAAHLKAPELEGFDENNVSRFHYALCLHAPADKRTHLPDDLLLAYDQNIVRHWRRITEKRNHAGPFLYPKYFQYLALLFTEIYLDWYFRDPDRLLAQLEAHVHAFNRGEYSVPGSPRGPIPEASRVEPYMKQDLNKVAFWMATGSGKTLLMHINILQYQHYLNLHGLPAAQGTRLRAGTCPRAAHRQAAQAGGTQVNRVILLTPNEGLSDQHLEEFRLSGIDAELFSKEGRGLFTGRAVEILDIHKLREEMGEKTVAVYGSNGQVGWNDEALARGPGIIVGRKGNPGTVTWVHTDFFAIDTTFYVVPKNKCPSLYFLFYALSVHDLPSLAADSAVPGLNRNFVYSNLQLVPPLMCWTDSTER